ncbi:MAG: flagellar hook-basal body complex protein FliE [Bradyrhizobium sp.]|jgi:flagellar hook-basal body complex protein FliE
MFFWRWRFCDDRNGTSMKTSMIDSGRIEAMISQLKAAATRPQAEVSNVAAGPVAVTKPGFADALKASLDGVNASQKTAVDLGSKFALGDDKVSLSDVMISSQKANIGFQATIQVRNKLVSAYQDIMNMQI